MTDLDETIPTRPDKNGSTGEASSPETPQSNTDLDQTTPSKVITDGEAEPADDPSPETGSRPIRWSWLIILGVLAIILVALLSGWSGYNAGIDLRREAQATQEASAIEEQYALALQEIDQGQYFRARQRLEYIIEHNPNYPGVTEKLADVLLMLNATATPTLVPTPTITPTPDTSQIEEVERLFNQAQGQVANEDWNGAIDTLLQVRKIDTGYEMVAVDGMLFISLRNRGVNKIGVQGELEEGMYDLGLAARFGPLDSEAEGYLTWAKLYVTGASFWELDWGQVVYYFSQVAPQYPSLRDGSGWTAMERYRLGLFHFGNTLLDAGEACQAVEQFQLSLSIAYDEQVEQALNEAEKECSGGEDEEEEDLDEEPQPQPTGELPPPLPTEEPTPYP